ncbi:MAG: F0F1 ATP synthase subunit A [Clostridia bacterium]|nr:F0F1 ATP synthase subunit A [Clostridia bacterium]
MDINIVGPKVFWTIDLPFEVPILGGKIEINETMIISWVVMLIITGLCIFLTHNLKVEKISKRQAVAEWLVELADKFTLGNMGEKFGNFIPFIAALFSLSIFSNLISLLGVRSPTADLNTEAAWAIVVFIMITHQKIKAGGIGGYLKGYTQPIVFLTPFNILSEFATPIGMACRHFGNILSGLVINSLIYAALAAASAALFGLFLPEAISSIPFLDVGIPAFLSVYFDWFSGVMQAFIFCMLTTKYISSAAEG